MINIYHITAFCLLFVYILCYLFVLIFTIKVLYELITISVGALIEKRKYK